MIHYAIRLAAVALLAGATASAPALAQSKGHIIVASTTSTEASGLFAHILPRFTEDSGVEARVVAVGTGAALEMGRRCDADALLVHAKPAERTFVANGHGTARYDVMYNDFIIVGPRSDPAGVKGMDDAPATLGKISNAKAEFYSRGDDSGTHKKELSLWSAAGIDPTSASGTWYRETGSGMGATLNIAAAANGYTMADRGTWISFDNRRDLAMLVEGDARLFNQYGVLPVNPEQCPSVNAAGAQAFKDWLLSDAGQQAIGSYRLRGQQLFTPNAGG